MLTPTSPRPPNEPKFSVGLPRGDNGIYIGPLCGKSLSVAGTTKEALHWHSGQFNCGYQRNFSVQQIQPRIWLPKNLTVGKYNRTVILQYGKTISK
jgi:hypothetical protein